MTNFFFLLAYCGRLLSIYEASFYMENLFFYYIYISQVSKHRKKRLLRFKRS